MKISFYSYFMVSYTLAYSLHRGRKEWLSGHGQLWSKNRFLFLLDFLLVQSDEVKEVCKDCSR